MNAAIGGASAFHGRRNETPGDRSKGCAGRGIVAFENV
jgi:hypothetical protein